MKSFFPIVLLAAACAAELSDVSPVNATTPNESRVLAHTIDGVRLWQSNLLDLGGEDLVKYTTSSSTQCLQWCLNIAKCYGVTWTQQYGGTCYIKGYDTLLASGKPATQPLFSVMVVPRDTFAMTLKWFENCDLEGFDTRNAPGESILECNQRYNSAKVTWSDYNRGTCWLKDHYTLQQCKYTKGVWSAFAFTEVTSQYIDPTPGNGDGGPTTFPPDDPPTTFSVARERGNSTQ